MELTKPALAAVGGRREVAPAPRALPWAPWLITSVVTLAAAALSALWVIRLPRLDGAPDIPWELVGLLYAVAGIVVVHIPVRRESHTVTLTEIPLVIGILACTPAGLLAGGVAGTFLALAVHRRQPPLKLCFNLALFGLETGVAVLVFRAVLGDRDALSAVSWPAAIAAGAASSLLSGLLIASVQSSVGDHRAWGRLGVTLAFAMSASLLNTSVAVAAVHVVGRDPASIVIVLIPGLALWLAYRGYLTESHRHTRMNVLYELSRAFQAARGSDEVVEILLSNTRELFRAELVELTLLPPDSDGVMVRHGLDGIDAIEVTTTTAAAANLAAVAVAGRPHIVHTTGGTDAEAVALSLRGIHDAMLVAIRGEEGLFGSLLVANRRADVTPFHEDDLALLETVSTLATVSLDNGEMAGALRRLAFEDVLTGLASRALLLGHLARALRDRTGEGPAVIFVDIDDFKTVNDSLGHTAGDRLLRGIASRLTGCLRSGDLAARLGGDEFAILVGDVYSTVDATSLASRIVEAIQRPFALDDVQLTVHASVGVVVAGGERDLTPEEMLRRADVAMYRAKSEGKDGWRLFQSHMQEGVVRRQRVQSLLVGALERGEVEVHYQPIVDLASRRAVGAEALVRWTHTEMGPIPPDEFIPLAEESGLISALGGMILETACRDAVPWARLLPDFVLTVNVSGRQLHDDLFCERVLATLRRTGLDGRNLVIEVTESIMVVDDPAIRRTMRELRGAGIRVAIDDFGTGYSSLGMLHQLPVDILKVAKPFVDGIDRNERDAAFAAGVVGLGHTLGLSMIAEGVESTTQADELEHMGCGAAQGWLFSRAVPADALGRLVGQEMSTSHPLAQITGGLSA